MKKTVLALFAHPDDAELMCTGTLSLLKQQGWEIHIATMTPGDKGSAVHNREEISAIRKSEAKNSARLLGGTYHCLEFEDVYIMYNRDTINAATALIRKVKPDIVFTASPVDYMVDHEMTSLVVQTACFCCGIKNMEVEETAFEPTPYLYYSDALEGKDKLGRPMPPSIYVDVSKEMALKEKMLACHASQRNWLLEHHKMDEYILAMKRFTESRGQEIGVGYAEGFRQHLGHGYPQDNILKVVLGEFVR
ncbi:N-acetylglucosaminyl deacetylase, LmbE family [Mariniphaga anaerophila]|uniref:N-acetylglucosaminyl deacetylase, LmbE family n=1 Tax=Mariniphaga anaerophila TaxID=1484053 RepID=A0A1M4SSK4_9BACT|nr:PIG-L family deacetylase [Mariniphaga anaerophila]SHE35165.1 N-acetylglucosaminyl deacetylase, LmbE family [Mariniphaga anaerophila]